LLQILFNVALEWFINLTEAEIFRSFVL